MPRSLSFRVINHCFCTCSEKHRLFCLSLPVNLSNLPSDDAELPLSDLQQETLHGWQRPSEALPPPNIQQPEVFPEPGPTMKSHERIDLVQDMTTDCSVVASLCAITARGEHGHSEVKYMSFRLLLMCRQHLRSSLLFFIRMIIIQCNLRCLLMENTSFDCILTVVFEKL